MCVSKRDAYCRFKLVCVMLRQNPLTPREPEVLRLIADGLSNGEIAASPVIRHETRETYVSRILTKLELQDRVQAVVYAYRNGLVN